MEADDKAIRYIYDAIGQLTSFTRSDGQSESYAYDVAGNAVWIRDGYGEKYNEFDALGRVIAVTDAETGEVKFRYEYDAAGKTVAVYLADGGMIRYTYDANGERTGYEYVEPTPQPSGMAKGASYYPFKDRMLRYEEEEETTWTKSSARRVVDAKAKEAQAAVWAADAAYEQAQACAPGSTMEYAARKAWEEANRARSEARAAQAAVENAKTPMSLSKAVSSAETAARNAKAAADKAQTNADRAVESAWARASQQLRDSMSIFVAEVKSPTGGGSCTDARYWNVDSKFELVLYSISTIGLDVAEYAGSVFVLIAASAAIPATAGASIVLAQVALEQLTVAGIDLAYDTTTVINDIEKFHRGEDVLVDRLAYLFPSFIIDLLREWGDEE